MFCYSGDPDPSRTTAKGYQRLDQNEGAEDPDRCHTTDSEMDDSCTESSDFVDSDSECGECTRTPTYIHTRKERGERHTYTHTHGCIIINQRIPCHGLSVYNSVSLLKKVNGL